MTNKNPLVISQLESRFINLKVISLAAEVPQVSGPNTVDTEDGYSTDEYEYEVTLDYIDKMNQEGVGAVLLTVLETLTDELGLFEILEVMTAFRDSLSTFVSAKSRISDDVAGLKQDLITVIDQFEKVLKDTSRLEVFYDALIEDIFDFEMYIDNISVPYVQTKILDGLGEAARLTLVVLNIMHHHYDDAQSLLNNEPTEEK